MSTELMMELIIRTFKTKCYYDEKNECIIVKRYNGKSASVAFVPNNKLFIWKNIKKILETALSEPDCPICFEKMGSFGTCSQCNNSYCMKCMKNMKNTNCPFCRIEHKAMIADKTIAEDS